MHTLELLLLGLLQAGTALFPASSLGHAVVVPSLLHWSVTGVDASFLPHLVLLHLGTAGALLVLYRAECAGIIAAPPGRLVAASRPAAPGLSAPRRW
ncbi:MAG: undecaprenyl-diphosphate phosphatase [Candidatus Dormibacteria bacterium]